VPRDISRVVITCFDCKTLHNLLLVLWRHRRLKPKVARKAIGLLDTTTIVRWRERRVFNISLWQNLDAIHEMGNVGEHVAASRLPARLGVDTRCGVFAYEGDWHVVLFGDGWSQEDPLVETDNRAQSPDGTK
jgi:hypothetical protein